MRGYAAAFDLASDDAAQVLDQVREAIAGWREAAGALRLPAREIDLFAGAFDA